MILLTDTEESLDAHNLSVGCEPSVALLEGLLRSVYLHVSEYEARARRAW